MIALIDDATSQKMFDFYYRDYFVCPEYAGRELRAATLHDIHPHVSAAVPTRPCKYYCVQPNM